MQVRTYSRALAVVMVLGMVGAACSSKKGGGTTPTPTGGHKGGSAIFGAEQWPQCLNIITACNSSTWMQIIGPQPTLPKLLGLDDKSNVVATPLVMEVPSIANGGVIKDPFSVTYHLNPAAVWDDGTKITGDDIDFTLKAIINTTATTSPVGYDKITSVETTGDTVKLNFSEPFADWQDLFGGGGVNSYVLKKSAFPDADPEKPDLKKEMNTLIPFSGGPWKMMSWSKSQEVLVRNDKYWGHQPLLDQVTFVPLTEQPVEITSLLSGTVDAIFTLGPLSVPRGGDPNVRWTSGPTNFADAFWFQLDDPVMKDFAVRQAIAYGVNRQAIVDQLVKEDDPDAQVLNCLPPLFPVVDAWCSSEIESEMASYSYDPGRSIGILEDDGFDCSNVPASPCTKAGRPLEITFYSGCSGYAQAVISLVQEQVKPAGLQIIPFAFEGTDLFCTTKLPILGGLQVGEFGVGGTVDPSPTAFSYQCEYGTGIPNDYGKNPLGYCDPQLDPIMDESDHELDPVARHQMITEVFAKINRDLAALPLFSEVAITGWRSDRVGGPIGQWNGAPYGTFWNMDYWYTTA
jgi:peptide/nickel transport system substrate-binding protein